MTDDPLPKKTLSQEALFQAALLQEAMGDIKPMAQDKAELGKPNNQDASMSIRRQAAIAETERDNALSSHRLKQIGPHDIVSYKRPGVQDGVYRKLRLGKYPIDAQLDLHQHTVEQARQALYCFIEDCMTYDLRTVAVLTGKGDRDPERKAVIKSHSVHWLEQIDHVLAFHSAPAQYGGAGAVYVLLKKSDAAKRDNREKHGLRG